MPKILCTPKFTAEDEAAVKAMAALLGFTPEEIVRKAVRDFCSVCVPTQEREYLTA